MSTGNGTLSKTWERETLGCLITTKIQNGVFVKKPEKGKGTLFANGVDMYRGITLDCERLQVPLEEVDRYLLNEGEVLVVSSSPKRAGFGQCCAGDFDKLGRRFIWLRQIDEECVHQNHVFAVRPEANRIFSELFAYRSQSPYGKAYLLSVAHKTNNLACIKTTKLKTFPVLLPSHVEQLEIVRACHCIDKKIQAARTKRGQVQDLFRTLLHELITVKTRVHALTFSGQAGKS
jgi:type I restriction enzyme S subunit